MVQLYPNEGLLRWLARCTADDLKFRIFTSNTTPDVDTQFSDLTVSTATAVVVSSGDWTSSGVAGNIGTTLAPPIAIENDTGGSVDGYGYVVTETGNDDIVAIARFDSAPLTRAIGEFWNIVPIIGDFSSSA